MIRWCLVALLLGGCSQQTFVRCTSCKREPYIALHELAFKTQWGYSCRDTQSCGGATGYDVDVRCTTPCATGMCDVACTSTTTNPTVTVDPRGPDNGHFTGPLQIDITLSQREPGAQVRYQSPLLWYTTHGTMLVCLDRRPSAEHAMVPCSHSGVSAHDPVFAIARKVRQSLYVSEKYTWQFLDKAIINETPLTARRTVTIGEHTVPLFSLADAFVQFRAAGGGIPPARYSLTLTHRRNQQQPDHAIELEVR
jgi:hypothetical protein